MFPTSFSFGFRKMGLAVRKHCLLLLLHCLLLIFEAEFETTGNPHQIVVGAGLLDYDLLKADGFLLVEYYRATT
jgi:hypothetical protein